MTRLAVCIIFIFIATGCALTSADQPCCGTTTPTDSPAATLAPPAATLVPPTVAHSAPRATLTPVAALPAEPDAVLLGKNEGYPCRDALTMFQERYKVGCFSATDKILPTRFVAHGLVVTPLRASPPRPITYSYHGIRYTVADYLGHQRATGLLILKNDNIVGEYYRYGRTAQDRFRSASMAKSISSLLISIAHEKGLIPSLDDPVEKYIAELKGTGYGQASIEMLLRMSSGIKFVEQYNGKDDVAKLGAAELGTIPDKPLQLLASFDTRTYPGGTHFAYASSEAAVLGYVLTRATGRDLASLTSEWLWQPLGTEADAAWNIGIDGQEGAEGKFNATLRDYARLGLMLAQDGAVDGKQIINQAYLRQATDAMNQSRAFRPRIATSYYGYGYLFWIFPMRTRTFARLGVYGQAIFVQPKSGIIMVQTAVNENASDSAANSERDALWRGVLSSLGGDPGE